MKRLNHRILQVPGDAYYHQNRCYRFCFVANDLKQACERLRYASNADWQTFAQVPTNAQKWPGITPDGMVKPFKTYAQRLVPRVPAHKPQTRSTRLSPECLGVTLSGGIITRQYFLDYCPGLISQRRKN